MKKALIPASLKGSFHGELRLLAPFPACYHSLVACYQATKLPNWKTSKLALVASLRG